MIITWLAKRDIRRQIRRGEALLCRVRQDGSDDIEIHLHRWRDNCEYVITKWFDKDHFLFQDISDAGFTIGVMVVGSGVSEVRRDCTAQYITGIEYCLKVLRDCQNEIKVNGLIKYSGKFAFKYLAASLVLIGVLVTIGFKLLGTENPNTDGSLTRQESLLDTTGSSKKSAELTRKALDNWVWEFDQSTVVSYDSILGEFNSRGVLQSGEYQSYLVRFRESKRRRRTHVIDSFYLAISLQGGDTIKLNHRR